MPKLYAANSQLAADFRLISGVPRTSRAENAPFSSDSGISVVDTAGSRDIIPVLRP
jgi:hypothetical protein